MRKRILVAMLAVGASLPLCAVTYQPATIHPPKPSREFRGAWVATVNNTDWPSKRSLSTSEQKAELLAMLDRAARLKLNAVIFQVRPACDALYASQLEPWSEYLTGTMGKPPEPFYDPLAFAVEEAHRRGLELHAWFNPYRALVKSPQSKPSADHVSRAHPALVRDYGKYLWLDPGEKETQDHSLRVVLDVLRRYDVDGIHFDDYFYPYAEAGADGRELDFPDVASWKKYGAGGKLSRNDWRRENVNAFVEHVYKAIKAAKPWVKFGVSPFGIWRPEHPPQIKGFDAYAKLYADSRKWLTKGWLDYLAPQLYWSIEGREQSFPVLLDWWNDQNPKGRHIWPGMNTTKVREPAGTTDPSRKARGPPWKPEEILSQIRLARGQPVSAGHIHWNMKSLSRGAGLGAALESGLYAEPALVPACHWLDATPPRKPGFRVAATGDASVKVSWDEPAGEKVSVWVLQWGRGGKWTTKILPGDRQSMILDGEAPDALALSAVDRVGNLGVAAALARRK